MVNFGTTSTIAGANYFTVFTRASPSACAAQNWGQNREKSSTGTYFVLVKISKGTFTTGTPAVKFDEVRVWLLNAPPVNEAALAARPDGDLTPFNATTMLPEAMQTRVFRADNTANNTCVRSGIQGIRLRVEGGTNTDFCSQNAAFPSERWRWKAEQIRIFAPNLTKLEWELPSQALQIKQLP